MVSVIEKIVSIMAIYGQWRCDYGGKTNCNPFITVNKFCYSNIPMVGKTIFVTKEEAEARLNELKGEKK